MKITCFIQSLFIVALVVHNLHLDAALNNRNPSVVFSESAVESVAQPQPQPQRAIQLQQSDYELLPDIQDVQDAILQDRDDSGPSGELFPENAVATKKIAKNRK
jgi:hypothetical protein